MPINWIDVSPVEALRILFGDRLRIHRSTTPRMSIINPLFVEGGLRYRKTGRKIDGAFVGTCGPDGSGGCFFYDEFELLRAGEVDNLNVAVFGDINNRKSALVKALIRRWSRIGYRTFVTDRKGEYSLLAGDIEGSRVIKLGKSGNSFINPVDELLSRKDQRDLVSSLILTVLGEGRSTLDIVEKQLLLHAITSAHQGDSGKQRADGITILDDVANTLLSPTQYMVEKMGRSREELKEMGYRMYHAVDSLVSAGFNKPTTQGLFDETPFLVFDCKGLIGDDAVVMVTLINFFVEAQLNSLEPRKRFHRIIHDETWDLAAYPGFVESLRRAFKLGRTAGVANWIVAHHLSNLYRSGASEAVRDLISDTDTIVLFKQDKSELERSAEELKNLNPSEIKHVVKQNRGHMLWKIGDRAGIPVKLVLLDGERALVETSHLVHGQTDLARAAR